MTAKIAEYVKEINDNIESLPGNGVAVMMMMMMMIVVGMMMMMMMWMMMMMMMWMMIDLLFRSSIGRSNV